MDYLGKLKNLITFGQIKGPADNSANSPVQQMEFKEKLIDAFQIFPYGVYSNVSSDDSIGVVFAIDGAEGNRAALSFTPYLRPTDLAQNETAFYHPYTKSFIKFRNNGDLEISTVENGAQGNIIINCESANVTANSEVNVTCEDANITANSEVNVTCEDLNVTASKNVIIDATTAVTVDCVTADVTATSAVTLTSPDVNVMGKLTTSGGAVSLNGGNKIARLGDAVQVIIPSGSSAGTWNGTITSAGVNTST